MVKGLRAASGGSRDVCNGSWGGLAGDFSSEGDIAHFLRAVIDLTVRGAHKCESVRIQIRCFSAGRRSSCRCDIGCCRHEHGTRPNMNNHEAKAARPTTYSPVRILD